jgi:hypothetical protein
MDLEQVINLANIIAKPYRITSLILGLLLVLSIIGNIYLATQGYDIDVDQENEYSDFNEVDVE